MSTRERLRRRQKASVRAPNRNPAPPSRDGARFEGQRRLPAQWLPLVPILALAALSFLPRPSGSPPLEASLVGAAIVLFILLLVLRTRVARQGRALSYDIVLRKVHYVQLVMQICVYAYWGWYWREVYRFAPLIIAQLAFAYALDMLVCWWRRDKWILGFGPFPIILSTNLFLWFRDDWFFLQFLMIATGVLGKEFLKWKREGRTTHIFNPSALSLFIFSVALLVTGGTGISWGVEIAASLHRPPHIYLEIFLLGLVVQALFSVTLVTLCAAAVLVGLNLIYTHTTGGYHFVDSNIPVSVFLGLHLLVTDPATSPRTSTGKVIFGGLYGAGVFAAYGALGWFGAPEFYDKLLSVPLLNLSVRGLDRFSEAAAVKVRAHFAAAWEWSQRWSPQRANLAHMSVWASLFTALMFTGFFNKGTDFPGGRVEFWKQACDQQRWNGCKTWVRVLNDMCQDGSGSACFTMGQALDQGRVVPRNAEAAGVGLGHACDLGIQDACTSLIKFVRGDGKAALQRSCDGGNGAGCFILGSLFSAGFGVSRDGMQAFRLFEQSCNDRWWRGCGRLGTSYLVGQGTAADPAKAVANFEKGCNGGNAASCLEAAKLYHEGVGTMRNDDLALERLQQACGLGLQSACRQTLGRDASRSAAVAR
jgi:Sel1 repeat